MSYIKPCNAPVSDDYAGHKNRPVPSREPGTDYACAYGTPLVSPASGRIVTVDNDPGGAEGRRWSLIADDGGQIDLIHNDAVYGLVGQRVEQGQVVARSGASGFGRNRYYGPHVHVTYRKRAGLPYSASSDFELTLASSAGDITPVNPESEDDEMERSVGAYIGGDASTPAEKRSCVIYYPGSGFYTTFSGVDQAYINDQARMHQCLNFGSITQKHWEQTIKPRLDALLAK